MSLADARQSLFTSIAGITFGIRSEDASLRLRTDPEMEDFLVEETVPDVNLEARWAELPEGSDDQRVFDSGAVWRLYRRGDEFRFRFHSEPFGAAPHKEACLSSDFSAGEVLLHRPYYEVGRPTNPMEFPLDELLMVHLLAAGRGVEIHSCGLVDENGDGHLFVGHSGAGKSTTAKLWRDEPGVTILSDDRIILRRMDGEFWMYGTPWHGELGLAASERAPLKNVYLLRHGPNNALVELRPADAAAQLLSRSFMPLYKPEALEFTLGFFQELAEAMPCRELTFVPDLNVVDFVRRAVN